MGLFVGNGPKVTQVSREAWRGTRVQNRKILPPTSPGKQPQSIVVSSRFVGMVER